jgi:hypothetical protein
MQADPMKTGELAFCVLTVLGALEMSYVESTILSHFGGTAGARKSLCEIYWRNLSPKNRWLFWSGALCMLSPFAFSLFSCIVP